MEDEKFAVKDSVQLLHGYTPTMSIAEIKEQKALCVWWDGSKTRKMHQEWLPLSVLKHTPDKTPIDVTGIMDSFRRL